MPLLCSGKSDIGLKRKTNQDSIYVGLDQKLFVVADGMGGHNGGDIASALIVKLLPEIFKEEVEHGIAPDKALQNAIFRCNNIILEKANAEPLLKGMGSTAVSIYFHQKTLLLANVGDSRCYLFNKDHIFQLSKDHSLVQEKIDMGVYSREESKHDEQRNVLVRTVGFEELDIVDLFTYQVLKGDLFLLCSDGLHGKLSDQKLFEIFRSTIPNPQEATQEMLDLFVNRCIAAANEAGGNDNISVIVVFAK